MCVGRAWARSSSHGAACVCLGESTITVCINRHTASHTHTHTPSEIHAMPLDDNWNIRIPSGTADTEISKRAKNLGRSANLQKGLGMGLGMGFRCACFVVYKALFNDFRPLLNLQLKPIEHIKGSHTRQYTLYRLLHNARLLPSDNRGRDYRTDFA